MGRRLSCSIRLLKPDKLQETFIDDEQTDMITAMKAYQEVGFAGPIEDDHVPRIINDTPGQHKSKAFASGNISAMMQVVESTPFLYIVE